MIASRENRPGSSAVILERSLTASGPHHHRLPGIWRSGAGGSRAAPSGTMRLIPCRDGAIKRILPGAGRSETGLVDPYITEWLNLLVRWLHVVAGIAWIGASFYFIALDLSL